MYNIESILVKKTSLSTHFWHVHLSINSLEVKIHTLTKFKLSRMIWNYYGENNVWDCWKSLINNVVFCSKRLATEYGNSLEFSDLWDRLQNDGRCCGVTGPQDYSTTPNRSYPISCCSPDVSEQITVSRRPLASPVVFRSDELTTLGILSRNNYTDMPESTWSHIVSAAREESKSVATCRAVYQQVNVHKN